MGRKIEERVNRNQKVRKLLSGTDEAGVGKRAREKAQKLENQPSARFIISSDTLRGGCRSSAEGEDFGRGYSASR